MIRVHLTIFYTDSTNSRWRFWTWPLASLPDNRRLLLFLPSPLCCSIDQQMLSVDLDDDFLSQNYSIPRNFHKSLDMRSSSKRIQCSQVWKLSLWIQLNDNQLLIKQKFIRLSHSIINLNATFTFWLPNFLAHWRNNHQRR